MRHTTKGKRMKPGKTVALAVLLLCSLFVTGCGGSHIRKIDVYGQARSKRPVDEAALAKSFGVSYSVYSRETDYIKRYQAYKAKQGVGTLKQVEWWLLSRKSGMLPSELIDRLLDEEQKRYQKAQQAQ